MRHFIRPAVALLFLLTLLTGVLYPLVITGLAQVLFPIRPTAASSSGTAALPGRPWSGRLLMIPAISGGVLLRRLPFHTTQPHRQLPTWGRRTLNC